MRMMALVLSVACASTQVGCATLGILEWSRDEVSVDGGSLRVKNVPTLPDGFYAIVGPASWPERPVVEAGDGILTLDPPIDLSVATSPGGPGAIEFREMDLSDAREPFLPRGEVVMATVACVERGPGRNFHVYVLRGDTSRQRWVRIGTVDIGPGTQSAARRPLAWAALPVTVVVDLVSLPFLFVGALMMGAAEGVGALQGD